MTGLELALLGGTIGKLVGAGTKSLSALGSANDMRLTPEQKRRLADLERMAAEDEFGMTAGERDAFRTQSLTPVQAAEKEAMARFGASQNIGDIGQGAAFRQQQALKQTSEAARAEIAKAAAIKDAEVARQQQMEHQRLLQQQQQVKALERQAALEAIGGIGETVAAGLGVMGEKKIADELYGKRIEQLKGVGQATSQGTQSLLGITSGKSPQTVEGGSQGYTPEDFQTSGLSTLLDLTSSGKSPQMLEVEGASASGTDALGQPGNVAGDMMMDNLWRYFVNIGGY
tara:strand:+ start:1445 stop:2302 length:858 start_codon:yes stop_codon:yes gene_type:complete